MKEYIDWLLEQLPTGPHKTYLMHHHREYAVWDREHEDYPLYEFFRAAGIPDPKDTKAKKVLGLI